MTAGSGSTPAAAAAADAPCHFLLLFFRLTIQSSRSPRTPKARRLRVRKCPQVTAAPLHSSGEITSGTWMDAKRRSHLPRRTAHRPSYCDGLNIQDSGRWEFGLFFIEKSKFGEEKKSSNIVCVSLCTRAKKATNVFTDTRVLFSGVNRTFLRLRKEKDIIKDNTHATSRQVQSQRRKITMSSTECFF